MENFTTTQVDFHHFFADSMGATLSKDQQISLLVPFSHHEIKLALFEIGDSKSPCSDGFTVAFFKKSWNIVGHDLCETILEFFLLWVTSLLHKLLSLACWYILQFTNFKEGDLPFRCLGLPLSSFRLTRENCSNLLDKISGKLLNWTTKSLSYAGKAQLLNLVIFGTHSFWLSIPLIHIAVLRQIDKLCRQLFWGCLEKKRKIFLKWQTICMPNKFWGFNIKEILSW